jgi:hypothetical protein
VYLVLLLGACAIICAVVVVAMGRGGEIAIFVRDRPVTFFPIRTPADVAGLRLPIGLLGYQVHATADALTALASLLAERDYEIATLRSELWRHGAARDEPADGDDQRSDRVIQASVLSPEDGDLPGGTAARGAEPGAQADLANSEQTWRQ